MTKVIARVHSVHLMNVEQRQAAADPQTKPPDLGCESACRLLSSTITIAIYYCLLHLFICSLSGIHVSRCWHREGHTPKLQMLMSKHLSRISAVRKQAK